MFVMDKSADGGSDSASRDNNTMSISRNSYKVTGSDVRLYVDSSHGHGGDHFASGWVATIYCTCRSLVQWST